MKQGELNNKLLFGVSNTSKISHSGSISFKSIENSSLNEGFANILNL
jgi:hypothetical protein